MPLACALRLLLEAYDVSFSNMNRNKEKIRQTNLRFSSVLRVRVVVRVFFILRPTERLSQSKPTLLENPTPRIGRAKLGIMRRFYSMRLSVDLLNAHANTKTQINFVFAFKTCFQMYAVCTLIISGLL